jgi:hypothetical protein
LPALGKSPATDHAAAASAALRLKPARDAARRGPTMTDYWLSKLFFDLQHDPNLAKEYRADMAAVIDRYPVGPDVRSALLGDDVAMLSPLVNAYLLRFYFQVRGMPEAEFVAKLRAMNGAGETVREQVGHG